VSDALDDTELGQLLAQLLRLVSPPPGDGTAGAHAPNATASRNGVAVAAGTARDDPWPGHAGAPSADGRPWDPASGAGPAAGVPQLSSSEARALIELVKARGIAQGELASVLGLEKSTVSRLAAGLERKGWIRRGRDEGNQRYVRLYLTADGGAVAARLWNAWHSRQTRILGALTAEEREGLSAGLRGLVRGLAAEGLLGDGPAAR